MKTVSMQTGIRYYVLIILTSSAHSILSYLRFRIYNKEMEINIETFVLLKAISGDRQGEHDQKLQKHANDYVV